MTSDIATRVMTEDDAAAVAALYARVFGPGQFARTAFRVREASAPKLALSAVAFAKAAPADLVGAVLMTPIAIGDDRCLLLGPIAVADRLQRNGVGAKLMRAVLDAVSAEADARENGDGDGEPAILLVGDPPFYEAFGFEQVQPGRISMPGPVDPGRLMVRTAPGGELPNGTVRAPD
ncbi:MAG: N-acetyltransferase [Pseudomonadota bacterium]